MKGILALAIKDILLLWRDKAGFFFVFFFPVIFGVFFGVIFSGEGGGMSAMPIVVVDEDQSEGSRRFVEALGKGSEITLIEKNREEATSLVRRGRQVAYVILPKGFGSAKGNLFRGQSIQVEVGVDPTRKAEAGMLQGVIMRHAFTDLQKLFTDRPAMLDQVNRWQEELNTDEALNPLTGMVLKRFLSQLSLFLSDLPENDEPNAATGEGVATGTEEEQTKSAWQPVKVDFQSIAVEKTGPKTPYDITYPQAIVWALLGCSAAFGVSLVTERVRGTLLRLRSAPITLSQILAGKALACFLTIMAASVSLFLIFWFFFGVRPGSYGLLVLAMVCSSLAFVGIMMLISVLGKTEASAGGIGWAVLLLMAMTGGGMVPLIAMPTWMQTFSNVSFVKWTVLAVEGAVWRGFSISEMIVPCGILLAVGLVGFVAGVRLFTVTTE